MLDLPEELADRVLRVHRADDPVLEPVPHGPDDVLARLALGQLLVRLVATLAVEGTDLRLPLGVPSRVELVTLTPAGVGCTVRHPVICKTLCCAGHTQQPPESPHIASRRQPEHPVVKLRICAGLAKVNIYIVV